VVTEGTVERGGDLVHHLSHPHPHHHHHSVHMQMGCGVWGKNKASGVAGRSDVLHGGLGWWRVGGVTHPSGRGCFGLAFAHVELLWLRSAMPSVPTRRGYRGSRGATS
jgi:hypothetical protein